MIDTSTFSQVRQKRQLLLVSLEDGLAELKLEETKLGKELLPILAKDLF